MPNVYKRKPTSSRGSWDRANMAEAIEKVRYKKMSIREAVKEYQVPFGTLHRRLKTSKEENDSHGPGGCLGEENEKKLGQYLKKMCHVGFPLDRTRARQLAYAFAEKLNIEHRFNNETKMAGYPWLSSFLRRNPDLSIRKSEGLSAARAKGLSRKAVSQIYDLLENEIITYKLQQKPQNIANCDESGLQLINSTGNVIADKGAKAVNQITTGEKGETVTFLACCTAEGRCLPPTVILKGKNKKPKFEDRMPIELLQSSEDNDVSLICLPPHTTQALQPLDRSFFAPLKAHFKVAANSWVQQNVGKRLTRYQFGRLLNIAWNKSATVGNGTGGFSTTGIYPFNRHAPPDYFLAVSDAMEVEDTRIPMKKLH